MAAVKPHNQDFHKLAKEVGANYVPEKTSHCCRASLHVSKQVAHSSFSNGCVFDTVVM
jgi:hypothetical protein